MLSTPNDPSEKEGQYRTKIDQRAGDHSTLFGQVFGNVKIKKVYQLFSLTSVLAILAYLLVGDNIKLYVDQIIQRPTQMTGDFNIAVAQFGQVTNEGIISSALATEISKLLFNFLDSEYQGVGFNLDVQIAHNKIGILTEDREAEQLAEAIDADVIIYGSIFVDGQEARLSPKFYVAKRANAQINTRELTGQHQLAVPILFDISSLTSQEEINNKLSSRAALLVYFTEGLIHYSAKDLKAANLAFQKAIDEAKKYGQFDGQEVVYLASSEVSRLEKNYEQASRDVNQALALNPDYGRGYIALGNIYYDQAVLNWDLDKLDQARLYFKKALQAKEKPTGAYIDEKANVSLGNIFVVSAQSTGDDKLFALAIDYYKRVITQYEQNKDERLKNIAANAYFGVGAAYERQGNYTQAIDAYQECIELADFDLKNRAQVQLKIVGHQ